MPDSDYKTDAMAFMDLPQDADGIEDESENEVAAAPARYSVTTHGADLRVEDLCLMQESGEIIVPRFQRSFVWSLEDSSKFIESLLMDWPVPGIFLARDAESDKFLVIDGQQRLKSLLFFRQGIFQPGSNRDSVPFALTGVHPELEGLTYANMWAGARSDFDNHLFSRYRCRKTLPGNRRYQHLPYFREIKYWRGTATTPGGAGRALRRQIDGHNPGNQSTSKLAQNLWKSRCSSEGSRIDSQILGICFP